MQIFHPNGMVERMNGRQERPELRDRYGRRKDGAPRNPITVRTATEQDRREKRREAIDPLRGRLFDLTT